METTSGTTKILVKGPEYLRKQMERESETKGRVSAVERLAASKPQYVKSQQVVNSTQEPAISLESASVSSTGSSNQSSKQDGNLVTGNNSAEATSSVQICSPVDVRRSSSKKRRDSLLLYRQKCDLVKGAANGRKHHVTHKRLLNSVNISVTLPEGADKECESKGNKELNSTPEGTARECSSRVFTSQSHRRRIGLAEQHSTESSDSGTKMTTGLLTVPEVEKRSGKGVSRSHSDISSRYSKNFADFDAFFKYCGLDNEIIDFLGKENFSVYSDDIEINIRSVSVSTSDDGFSKASGDSDGLPEDELQEKMRQGTSVIERNARIIKWLYSCKNATETGKTLRDLH